MAGSQLEAPKIVFTDEAESALRRALMHYERRLRSEAVEFAVRTRGTPAEITGSDIQRAYAFSRRPIHSSKRRDMDIHSGSFSVDQRFFPDPGPLPRDPFRLIPHKLKLVLRFYRVSGFFLLAVGAIVPFVYDTFKALSNTEGFRIGLALMFLGATGITLSYGADFLFRMRQEKRREMREVVEDVQRP